MCEFLLSPLLSLLDDDDDDDDDKEEHNADDVSPFTALPLIVRHNQLEQNNPKGIALCTLDKLKL